ncbi:Flagellar biosynthesis anti-sigma factor FlgM [Sphingomonas sp. EC-HK361]|uniref:flagellar biosynthesis anti-sigma factor FlgM n=1 Tax=Sphingomonas sp. EC-HK361 TaxID=2038397 RepID=UPI001257F91C|nr:flagellar biosynthesis anti-sigma factor FlgM [Sphingomonas sp. EC-HK361]VVT06744.1 Flagellar biosynthesis anti-sigma factor FlgM [Sphingomonas sp. EC-HK361]
MVDSVGSVPGSITDRRVGAVTRVQTVRTVFSAANAGEAAAVQAPQTLAAELAAAAPVDLDRIAEIKAAVQAGTFPILPAKIADQLIALRLEWMRDDQA